MEKFNAKKYKRYTVAGLIVFALLMILLFAFAPVKFLNVALRKEAYEKDREVKRLVDFELFGFTK